MTTAVLARTTPIGVAWGGRYVQAAQLVRHRRGWALREALRVPRPVPEAPLEAAEIAHLVEVFARQRFRGTAVVVAMPEDRVMTALLELPGRGSGAPVEEIARTELASMHGCDPEAAETVCWDLPGRGGGRELAHVMAVGCRHADAEALLALCEGAGLEVAAIDCHLHAMVRACGTLADPEKLTAILDLGWDRATLILVHGRTIVYRRDVPEAAVRTLALELVDDVGVDEDAADYLLREVGLAGAEADAGRRAGDAGALEAAGAPIRVHLDRLVDAVQPPFSYVAKQCGGTQVTEVLLAGCGAAIPGADAHLASRLAARVRTVRPADLAVADEVRDAVAADPGLVLAMGLARFDTRERR